MNTNIPFQLINRHFQIWEYQVSHGQLLIRSPKSAERLTNIDLICLGVEYVALPRHFTGLDFSEPSQEEIRQLEALLEKRITAPHKIKTIFSSFSDYWRERRTAPARRDEGV